MDLWASLGISREAGIGLVVAILVVAWVIAGRVRRRSREPERVRLDLTGRG